MFSSSHLHRSSLFKNSFRFLQQQQNIISNIKKKRKLNFDELHAAATLTEQCSTSSSSSSSSSNSKTCFQIWNSFLSNQQKQQQQQQQPSGNININNNNKVVSSPFTTNVLFGTVQLLDKSGNWSRAMELLAAGHFSLNEANAKKEAENYFAELKSKKQQNFDSNNSQSKNNQKLTNLSPEKSADEKKLKHEISTTKVETNSVSVSSPSQDDAGEKRLTFIQELILTANSILEEQQRRQYRFEANLRKMKSASSSSAEVARLSQSYQKERQERYQVFSRVFTAALDELSATSHSSSVPRKSTKKNFQQQSQKEQDEEFLEQDKKMREADLLLQLVSVCCKSHQLQQNYYCVSDASGGNVNATDMENSFSSSSVWTQDSEWPMLALDAALVRLLIVTSTPEEIVFFSSSSSGNFLSNSSSSSSVPLIVACIAKCCASQNGDENTNHVSELFHNSLLTASSSSSSSSSSVVGVSLFQVYDYYSARQQEAHAPSTSCGVFCLDDLTLLFFRAFLVEPDLASSLVHQCKSAQEIFIVLEVAISHFFIHSAVTGSPTKHTIDWNKQNASQIHGLHHDDAKSKMFGINRLLDVVRNVHQHDGDNTNNFNHDKKIDNPKRIKNQTGKMAILQLWPFMTLLLDSILTDPGQNFARTDLRRILMVEDWLSTFNHMNADISQENTFKLVDYVVILCWESITSCVFSSSSISFSNSSSVVDEAKATTSTLNIVKQAVTPSIRKCCDILASLPIIERFENLASFIFVSSAVLGIDMHDNNTSIMNNANSLSKSNIALVLLRHAMFLEKDQLHPESLEGRDYEGLANSKKMLELLEDCSNSETSNSTSISINSSSPLTETTFKKWLPYFDRSQNHGNNSTSYASSFCIAPTVAGSFYKLVFQALSRIQLQQKQNNDTTNHDPQRAGFLSKDPNGKSFYKNSNNNNIHSNRSTTTSHMSYATCWQRVLKLISCSNPLQQHQQQQQVRTLLFFTPHLQHAAFIACADTKSWALGLTLYNMTKTNGVPLQQSSVPIILDFMRRMKNPAPIISSKNDSSSSNGLPTKFRDKRTGDEWDLAVDSTKTRIDKNDDGLLKSKPWLEAVRLVFSAYNLRVSNPKRNAPQQQQQQETQNIEDQNGAFFSSQFTALLDSIQMINTNKNKSNIRFPTFVSSNNNTSSNNNIHYSHPHPLLMSRLSQIVSNHTKQFSPLSPQASTWQEVCFYFSVILHTEINNNNNGGSGSNATSASSNHHNYNFQRNQQNQLINKSCGPDFFAPVLIRLADHGRWKEASIVASSMIANHKLVNPIQLVPFVSKSGLHSHWKDVLRGFVDSVQQGYLAPPHAVATATCMAVNSFLSMPSEIFLPFSPETQQPTQNPSEIEMGGAAFNFETEQNAQNQSESSTASSSSSVDAAYFGKNPNAIRNQHARVACVGVLHWMIKQRVFASKDQMTGHKENKKRIIDAVQAVCAENDTLLCSMLVQKCLNEL